MREKKHYVFFVIIASIVCSLLILLVISIWRLNVKLDFSKLPESADFLASQTTTSLEIITAGITLFTIFGGFLSVVNIFLSRDLYRAVDEAKEAMDSYQELIGFRLLQEGREYVNDEKFKYAACKFEEAIDTYPDTIAALQAEYELAQLHADILAKKKGNTHEVLCENRETIEELIEKLKKHKLKTLDCKCLMGDAYYLLGCTCGSYFKEAKKRGESDSLENREILNLSIDAFKNARKHDEANVDFLVNSVISYGMADDWTKCEKALNSAQHIAATEPLYANTMTSDYLNSVFQDYYSCFPAELADRLKSKIEEMTEAAHCSNL